MSERLCDKQGLREQPGLSVRHGRNPNLPLLLAAYYRRSHPCAINLRENGTRTRSHALSEFVLGFPDSYKRASTLRACWRPGQSPEPGRARQTLFLRLQSSSHQYSSLAEISLHIRNLVLAKVKERCGQHRAGASRGQCLMKVFWVSRATRRNDGNA